MIRRLLALALAVASVLPTRAAFNATRGKLSNSSSSSPYSLEANKIYDVPDGQTVTIRLLRSCVRLMPEMTGETANAAMAEADRILTERTDFAIVRLFASGVKDATSATNTDESAEIKIVDDVRIDRTSDADNNLVTLTWQYVAGTFSSPRILAAAELSTNAFETVEMTDPVQIEWGETFAFVATAKVPKERYGAQAFFKIVGTPDAPVDDGQVFDIYSDGTDYTVDFIPSRKYRMRIVSGRICGITLVE